MAGRAIALLFALLPAAASAYKQTHPVVAWSSHNSKALSSLAVSEAARTNSHSIANALYTHDDICDHDAVIVIEHAGLHASDLRTLPPTCSMSKALSSAPSSLHLAYVRSGDRGANPFVDLSGELTRRCGSRAVSHAPDLGELALDGEKGKHVICISLPPLENGRQGTSRKNNMANHESWLSGELAKMEAVFSNYLVIYTGAPVSSLHARQSSITSTFEARAEASPSGGILKRYQLLTPGLILALLVILFVLIPVIFLGVTALSSIQSPLTNDIPKGFSAEEKKNQ